MKTFDVYASQLVFYKKTVIANSIEEAEELAWESSDENGWEEVQYGDWELEDIKAVTNSNEEVTA